MCKFLPIFLPEGAKMMKIINNMTHYEFLYSVGVIPVRALKNL